MNFELVELVQKGAPNWCEDLLIRRVWAHHLMRKVDRDRKQNCRCIIVSGNNINTDFKDGNVKTVVKRTMPELRSHSYLALRDLNNNIDITKKGQLIIRVWTGVEYILIECQLHINRIRMCGWMHSASLLPTNSHMFGHHITLHKHGEKKHDPAYLG